MVSALLKVCGVQLREVLPDSRLYNAKDVYVTSCNADSRKCQEGDVFVAIVGDESDGHHHVQAAIARGAAAIVAERFLPTGDVPLCVVEDSREALGRLCQALAGHPSGQMNVIGVTGTNGKTTTCCLINAIFKVAGFRSGIMGTLGYCDGRRTLPAPLTTPTAPVLASCLEQMHGQGCTHAVIEVSSHALAQRRTAGIEFDTVCVTNVRHDHLDYHGSLKNYRNAKGRLFDQVRPEGLVVLNLDDDVSRDEYLTRVPGPMLTVGLDGEAEITGTLIERFPGEQTFLLQCGNEAIPVRTRIIGDHHIYNCLAAAAVGLAYGIDLPTIVRGLELVDEMPGRLQRIEQGQPYQVFVDYAHTPDALQNSLSTLRETTTGRLICVFGAGGDRDAAKRPLMGQQVAQWADAAVLTDDNPRTESSFAIMNDIMRGIEKGFQVQVQPDRAAAIQLALDMAQPGDCVLIAGKGHEMYQDFGDRRIEFDDREVARQYLADAEPGLAAAQRRRAA